MCRKPMQIHPILIMEACWASLSQHKLGTLSLRAMDMTRVILF